MFELWRLAPSVVEIRVAIVAVTTVGSSWKSGCAWLCCGSSALALLAWLNRGRITPSGREEVVSPVVPSKCLRAPGMCERPRAPSTTHWHIALNNSSACSGSSACLWWFKARHVAYMSRAARVSCSCVRSNGLVHVTCECSLV